jgi:hypothetical protein
MGRLRRGHPESRVLLQAEIDQFCVDQHSLEAEIERLRATYAEGAPQPMAAVRRHPWCLEHRMCDRCRSCSSGMSMRSSRCIARAMW